MIGNKIFPPNTFRRLSRFRTLDSIKKIKASNYETVIEFFKTMFKTFDISFKKDKSQVIKISPTVGGVKKKKLDKTVDKTGYKSILKDKSNGKVGEEKQNSMQIEINDNDD